MKNKKVLLTTVFTGYNYGSSLQAFAGKAFLSSLGLDCKLVARKSLIKGRNIQLRKLLVIAFRSLFVSKKGLTTFQKQYAKVMIGNSAEKFLQFEREYLCPCYLSWHELKREAANSNACFAGSDQIWNSSALYVDSLYYLRFAPQKKRVAFAPSFGRDFVAEYNRKKMALWIADIPYLSVREDSGVTLVKLLTERKATQLIDPTLMISSEQWCSLFSLPSGTNHYILAYFLDTPSDKARMVLKEMSALLKCKVISIPHEFADMTYCDEKVAAGPIEFLNLVKKAQLVCTDSFHGTAFSINFHTPFYAFERAYGTASKQSSRVLSILKKVNMLDRYEPKGNYEKWNYIDFEQSDKILGEERIKCKTYVREALDKIENE